MKQHSAICFQEQVLRELLTILQLAIEN